MQFANIILTSHRRIKNCPIFFNGDFTCIAFSIYIPKRSFGGETRWSLHSLEGAGRQTVDARSTFWVLLGHGGSNEPYGRSVAPKLRPQQSDGVIHQSESENRENLKFYM